MRAKLNALADWTYEHLRGIFLILVLILTIASLLSAGLAIYLYKKVGDNAEQTAAQGVAQSQALAAQNRKLIKRIQDERTASIIRGCKGRNKRHDNTIKALEKQYNFARDNLLPGQTRAALTDGQQRVTLIIESIVPKEDCKALAKAAVNTTKNENEAP